MCQEVTILQKMNTLRDILRGIFPALGEIAARMWTRSALDGAIALGGGRSAVRIVTSTVPLEQHQVAPFAHGVAELTIAALEEYQNGL